RRPSTPPLKRPESADASTPGAGTQDPKRYAPRMNAVKSTRRRSSGTRQALASQLSMRSQSSFVGLGLLFGRRLARLRRRLVLLYIGCDGLMLNFGLPLTRRSPRPLRSLLDPGLLEEGERAARGLDLLARGRRGRMDGNGELLGDLADAE